MAHVLACMLRVHLHYGASGLAPALFCTLTSSFKPCSRPLITYLIALLIVVGLSDTLVGLPDTLVSLPDAAA